jgi:predicted nuclease with TOPRIM domain
MKLDEINNLIDYTTKIKGELNEGDKEIEYLKRTKNSLNNIHSKLKEAFKKINSI